MRIASPGHAALALVMIALGSQGLITRQFTAVWDPVPKGAPAREVLIYLCALISLASGLGSLWKRTAGIAARAMWAWLLLWVLVFRVPVIVRAPASILSWDGWAETTAMLSGAWVLYAWFAEAWDRRRLGFATGESGVRLARALYGLALIPSGLVHLAYINATASLVPAWIPAHTFWAYFTGVAFLAAGAGLVLGVFTRLAAALSALQIGLFTLLCGCRSWCRAPRTRISGASSRSRPRSPPRRGWWRIPVAR